MANFRTHVLGAALPALAGAALATAGGLVDPRGGLACFALGALGGVLPDIDAESSVPTRIIFGALACAAAAAAALALPDQPPATRALAAVGGFLAVGVGLRRLTARLSVHRGLIHSLPVAAIVGAALALAASRLLGAPPARAWLYGAFLSAGFVVHLALDELFSVDLVNARVKRSIGTALKLGSRRRLLLSALLYAGLAGLVAAGPPLGEFTASVTSSRTRRAVMATLAGLF